ncbi:MAG: ribosome biogenesis GTPase Der [Opitutales bacterium]|nr:ribosome biogenesis GTPase Der [Opitutales bacterium]
MSTNRTVALVGRPNVGKSRLFNRLAGRRIAIVHDQAGVTRDVNAIELRDQSGPYTLLDTGGIGLEDANTPKKLIEAAEEQVFVAVETASVICLVVDAREGLTTLDALIADRLRKSGKPIVLIVNKVDNETMEHRAFEFARLGLGTGVSASAEHGYNEDALRRAIASKLPPCENPDENSEEVHRTRICFLGRPNVGKSSLCNALLKSDRMVVSEVPGTTRDSVELNLDYTDKNGELTPFRLVDTAGMRRKTQVSSPVEYFSAVRSEDSVARSDVVFVVLDAMDGVTKQEQHLLGKALTLAPSVAVLVNKWDYAVEAIREGKLPHYKNEREYREAFEKSVREMLFFLPESPILFVSAKTGLFVENILALATSLNKRMDEKMSTGAVNRLIQKMFERRAPVRKEGKRFKAYYALQTGNRPFSIRIFCNSVEKLDDNYRRYLERGFIKEFDLQGCPLRFTLIGKPARYRKDA